MIAPSILSSDFSRLGDEIRAISQAGADLIHIDVMDGHFVPNITLGPDIVSSIKSCTHCPLDVHLMIESPDKYIEAFAQAGASIITVHIEACKHLHKTIQHIIECGVSPGVAINPSTPINQLEAILEEIDLVLIMTVNPGFGGQKVVPLTLRKVKQLKDMILESNLVKPPLIEIDGGVKLQNVCDFVNADVIVSGSGIFDAPKQLNHTKNKKLMTVDELEESYRHIINKYHHALKNYTSLVT